MNLAQKIADALMDIDPGLHIYPSDGRNGVDLRMDRLSAMRLLELLTKIGEKDEASSPVQ